MPGTALGQILSTTSLYTAAEIESLVGTTILSTTTGIDALVATTTNLYTAPGGGNGVVVTGAVIRVTAISGGGSKPRLGIGIAAGEDGIFFPETLVGMDATTKVYVFASERTLVRAAPNDIIKLGIDNAATYATYTIAVDLFGYKL